MYEFPKNTLAHTLCMIPRIPIVTRSNKYHLLLTLLPFGKTHPSESSLPSKIHPSLCFGLKQHTE
ncbi:hypothetical protein SS50377_20014 [Spironucleus salmonicida]|uniref:Uncharacterized protein n=1 Tax=Spironucleus salmonicida TaxID=348837 RepID=A0A9P8LYK6_9EUKA|nr:hypothetical protein SS50377_20009 [Spironucleus salmonicida]KAH0576668.1 hypothetical protein SS50377_20014 [Spironucleus salmonicida]